MTVASAGADVDFTLCLLGAVRLIVLDASTRAPIPDAAIPGYETEREGDALLVYGQSFVSVKRMSIRARVVAPGYVPRDVWLTLPDSGVVDLEGPVLLEKGLQLLGSLEAPDGRPLAAGTVVVERLGESGEIRGQEFFSVSLRGGDLWRFPALRPGRYRLRAFSPGFGPGRQTIDLRSTEPPHRVRLPAKGAEGPPDESGHAWPERREIELPLALEGGKAAELIAWIEEVAGVRLGREAGVEERLASSEISVSLREGIRLHRAVRVIARAVDLDFDEERGILWLPRR
ncbi:MAG: carboxypeptidase-like regulatory domain-containing protein [Planctomycetales bacterium]|nr:carboxypeptidase-like regulatory domain-containing protein [Planctomycetales bacterium]